MFGRSRRKQKPSRSSRARTASGLGAIEKFVVEEIELAGAPGPAPPRAHTAAPRWLPGVRLAATWLGLWLLLVAAALVARAAWPVDETRVLAVAWEMWTRPSFLVPLLNGEPHAAPPLMYWLVHAGWSLFGVTEAWTRVVPALAALLSLIVTARVARLLWPDKVAGSDLIHRVPATHPSGRPLGGTFGVVPDNSRGQRSEEPGEHDPEIARYAPLVLIGTLGFAFYVTLGLPDMLLVLAVLLVMWALVLHWRRRDMRSFLLLGPGLGLGLLAGGALVLVYVLPVALAAPLWARGGPKVKWGYWYADLAKALAIGFAVLAVWLVPTALSVGLPYAVRWVSESLVLLRLEALPNAPPWSHVVWLPLVFLPWSLLPLLWMRLWHLRRAPLDPGLGFCLYWILLGVAALSMLPLRQPQFLLPLLPAGALAVARLWLDRALIEADADKAHSGMAIPLVLLGALLLVLPRLPRLDPLPGFLWEIPPLAGLGVIALGVALAFLPHTEIRRRLRETAAANALLVVLVVLAAGAQLDALHRPDEVAQFLAQVEAEQRPIAVVGEYRGEFQFPGRLKAPPRVLAPAEAERWALWYPDGVLVAESGVWHPRVAARPAFETWWRDRMIRIWDAREVAVHGARSGIEPLREDAAAGLP